MFKFFKRKSSSKNPVDLLSEDRDFNEWCSYFKSMSAAEFLDLGQNIIDQISEKFTDDLIRSGNSIINKDNFNQAVVFIFAVAKHAMEAAHFQKNLSLEQRTSLEGCARAYQSVGEIVEGFNSNKQRLIEYENAWHSLNDFCSQYGFRSENYKRVIEIDEVNYFRA
mgnify:CR=1 FL=1